MRECAWTLPEPHRSEALDGVARIARETRRRSAARSRITPTTTLQRGEPRAEHYRVTEEHRHWPGHAADFSSSRSSGRASEDTEDNEESLTEADRHLEQELRRMKLAESLLGTCRAARAPHDLGVM